MRNYPTLLVIVGPTASGKTRLAVEIARLLGGEIVSADSRQVYKGLDIGSGKDRSSYGRVPVHLLDVASPRRVFTVAQYQRLARRAIADIHRRGKLPILCGGSGLYVDSITKGLSLPSSKPDAKLRQRLASRTLPQLLAQLRRLDMSAYKIIDRKNRRRVERAIETLVHTKKPLAESRKLNAIPYRVTTIGLSVPLDKLQGRIKLRLKLRMKQGLVAEVCKLRRQLSDRRLISLGLEYAWVTRYLRGELTRAEMETGLARAIYQFARRQMTWFRRDSGISWMKA
jgi:tRNA dimethylallyltransferase